MRKTIAFTAAVLAVLAVAPSALSQDASDSKLTVLTPTALARLYDHSEALFGMPPYGGAVRGQVVVLDSVATNFGCNSYQRDPSWPTGAVLLVERGNCTFAEKVRKAQAAGAVAVLVADNEKMCGDSGCQQCGPNCGLDHRCKCRLPYMNGDGFVGDIIVPSFLIRMSDGQRMRDCIAGVGSGCKPNTPVVVELRWDLPTSDDRVTVQLWSKCVDTAADNFKSSFEPLALALGNRISFTPHVWMDPPYMYCFNNFDECGDMCTNKGRYCEYAPDLIGPGVTGSQVIVEDLRQLCLWQSVGNSSAATWWRYVNQFTQNCRGSRFTTACSDQQLQGLGVDMTKFYRCISDSGGVDWDSGENRLLNAELARQYDMNLFHFPVVLVNGVRLQAAAKTSMSDSLVFQAICHGFTAGSEPTVCSCSSLTSTELRACVEAGGMDRYRKTDSGVSIGTVIVLFLVVLALVGVAGFAYTRYTQRRMRDQVRHILSEYMPLDDAPVHGREAQI